MAVLIILPVILQTVINLIMLSIGGQGEFYHKIINQGYEEQELHLIPWC